jgi:hypothetical protein
MCSPDFPFLAGLVASFSGVSLGRTIRVARPSRVCLRAGYCGGAVRGARLAGENRKGMRCRGRGCRGSNDAAVRERASGSTVARAKVLVQKPL